TGRKVETPAREEPRLSVVATKEEPPVTPCTHCGSLVETRYAFCWNCGKSLTPENEPSVTRSKGTIPSAASATEDEEQTVEHDVVSVGSPMFSWALPKESERPTSGNSATLKLIAIVVVGLVMGSLGLFVLMRSPARMAAVTAAQPVTPDVQSNPSLAPG